MPALSPRAPEGRALDLEVDTVRPNQSIATPFVTSTNTEVAEVVVYSTVPAMSNRKRPRNEEHSGIRLPFSAPVASSPTRASSMDPQFLLSPPQLQLPSLPTFQQSFAPPQMPAVVAKPSEGDRFFLFKVAKKHGLKWAIEGKESSSAGELGRPPVASTPDQLHLSPGAAFDLLTSVNNHLDIPPGNSVPEGYGQVIASSSKRAQPHLSSGLQPIPMSRYSSEASALSSFLDRTPAAHGTADLPPPVYTSALRNFQRNSLSSIEGITAANILRDLPQAEMEDRSDVLDHICALFFTILRCSGEGVGSELRTTRQIQLASADQAIREELVNQPILSDRLYSDTSTLSTPMAARPSPLRQEHYSPLFPAETVRTHSYPHFSDVTPFQGAQSIPGSPDGSLSLLQEDRTPSPPPLKLSRTDQGESH